MPDNYTNVRPEMDEEGLKNLAEKMKAGERSQLYVRKVKLGVKNLSFLEHFDHLTALFIDEVKAGLNALKYLENLQTLTLLRLRQLKPTALRGVPQLRELYLGSTSLTAFDGFEALTNLELLSLRSVSGLEDAAFISELTSLKTLSISDSRGLTAIPSLANLSSLTEVRIDGMSDLESIEGVFDAPCLQKLVLGELTKIEPEAVRPALDHPTLERIYPALVGMEGAAKDDAAAEILKPRFGDVFER